MINEDRVKQIYKIALYEQNEEREHRQVDLYYQSDYIGKELIKSFFTGSIAYLVMAILWVMGNWSDVLRQINNLKIIDTVITMLVIYVLFLIIYLFATGLVYAFRYKHSKETRTAYHKNLKRLYQMYEREEKLKS